MERTLRFLLAAVFPLLFGSFAVAQDLVYKPKNPAFGGDTFNYNWLLSSAQAQDLISEEETRLRASQRSTLQDFSESLQRQLLSQLSRQIITAQFGEEGLEPGTFIVGNFQVDVGSSLDGVLVTIFDASTGEQTQITVPFF